MGIWSVGANWVEFFCFSLHSLSVSSLWISCPLSHLFCICIRPASLLHSTASACWWLGLTCQKSELLVWASSSSQAAIVQPYWNRLKVNVVFRGIWVFRPDGDISIVYWPLCARLSPNRDSGCSQNTESHRETVYHILKNQLCLCMHVLPGTKTGDFVLIATVASYSKYWMFSNKVEIWVLNDRRGSASEYNGN